MELIFSEDKNFYFPEQSQTDESGIIAMGGDLLPERLLFAYKNGIFPWYNEDEPITWWCPDPRFVLFPEELKVSKSMRPYFNQEKYRVTYNTCFEQVMMACGATPRKDQNGTWITPAMLEAYKNLFALGKIISVEVWQEDDLVGGLYGIKMEKIFFGESMFAYASNASKFGFISLVHRMQAAGTIALIDCQQETEHLRSLGGRAIPRVDFLKLLKDYA